MNSDESRIIRVAPATVIVFSVLLSPALWVAGLMVFRGQQLGDAIGLCLLYLGAIGFFCSPSIELSPNKLVYRTLLRRRSVALSEVTRAQMRAAPAPTLTLSRKRGGGAPLSFVVKPFSKEGVQAIFAHIRAYSPDAKLDRISADMAAGDFNSITRAAISTQNLLRIAMAGASVVIGSAIVRLFFLR